MKRAKKRSSCPISFALDIFGDKWTLLVVRDLLFMDKAYYGDFLESEEGIATNILADRLRLLEQAEIVAKRQDQKIKTKIIYSLTKKGIDLLPVLFEILLWSTKYHPETSAPKDFLALARKNKEGMIRQIRAKLRRKSFQVLS